MDETNDFQKLFKGFIFKSIDFGMTNLEKTYNFGFCDDKDEKEKEINQLKNADRIAFIEVFDSSEAAVFLRRYLRRTAYNWENPEKKQGKYVYIYIIPE